MRAAKTDDLSFIPEIHRVERENCFLSNCPLTHRINKKNTALTTPECMCGIKTLLGFISSIVSQTMSFVLVF